MLRIVTFYVVKQEHLDERVLRYLRLCNWDIIKPYKSMDWSLDWCIIRVAVDEYIMRFGDGGAVEDERNDEGYIRVLDAEFITLLRSAACTVTKEGSAIILARLHKLSEFSLEHMDRNIFYLLMIVRLSLMLPAKLA